MNTIVIFTALVFLVATIYAKSQRACVMGRLRCPSTPEKVDNVKIELFDKDRFSGDDKMGTTTTDKYGIFGLCGTATDFVGDIEPYIKIHHPCNADRGCTRILKKTLDDGAIGGEQNMGQINLQQDSDQSTECD